MIPYEKNEVNFIKKSIFEKLLIFKSNKNVKKYKKNACVKNTVFGILEIYKLILRGLQAVIIDQEPGVKPSPTLGGFLAYVFFKVIMSQYWEKFLAPPTLSGFLLLGQK